MDQNKAAGELFNAQFKFAVNQEVRHKADKKNSFGNSDMGMLIMERILRESVDDNGSTFYTRHYVCRCIKFGDSGDLIWFKESELLDMDTYRAKAAEEEEKREEASAAIRRLKSRVFESFGVKRDTKIVLVNDPDQTNIYEVSGWHSSGEGTVLTASLIAGQGKPQKTIEIKSSTEFKIVE